LAIFQQAAAQDASKRQLYDLIELIINKIAIDESKKGGSSKLEGSNSLFTLIIMASYLANQIIENFDKSEEKEEEKKSEE
jgi:hypothetical protein